MSVYNGQNYLDDAIQSILTQTYKDFEFIIINDGSTDKSLEIIKKYQMFDERIILISRENKGLIASLNEGIEHSRGKYIARMDADDISLPTRFEEQIKFMEKNEHIGVCGTAIIGFSEHTQEKVWTLNTANTTLKTELLFSSCFAHPSIFIRKKVIDQYNLLYDSNFPHAEDFELWTRIADYTDFANISTPLLKYRILQSSATRQADQDHNQRFEIIKKIFIKYLDQLGIQNSEEENRLHFTLSVTSRIQTNRINFTALENYFQKLVQANEVKKLFNSTELKKILGKKWIWNLYYRKELQGFFSKYFFYGLWSLLSK